MTTALVTYSNKPRGGVVHTLALAEALFDAGEDIHVIALGDDETGFYRPVNVPHTFIPAPPWADTLDERVFRSVDALAEGLTPLVDRFAILHTQDCIAARAACRVRDEASGSAHRVTVARTVHHVDDFTTQALIDCQRQAIFEPDELIVVSQHWRELLAREYEVEATVIYNGVDAARLTAGPGFDREAVRATISAGDRFLFLTVGGIEPRKGTLEMIEALALLKRRLGVPPLLVIVGGHSFQDHAAYREAALQRAGELGLSLESDIVILGTVSERELVEWYNSADGFLFPSVKEGWGLVAMEAMAAGLPLIASDIPVFREYLVDGESALLIRPGDPESLAEGVQRVLEDEHLRSRLQEEGLDLVRRFTWDRAAADHRALYETLRTDQQLPAG